MSNTSPESRATQSLMQNAAFPLFIMQAWATSIQVFFRANIGARYLGLQAAAVFILAPLYCYIKQVKNLDSMYLWLSFYLFWCCFHRCVARRRQRANDPYHSYYCGFPILWKLFPRLRCSEVTFKRFFEPALIAILGVLYLPSDEPLGTYLIIGAYCMSFTTGLSAIHEQTRLMDLTDSLIDQQALAEQLRERRGDR